jgi:hypothetical protein
MRLKTIWQTVFWIICGFISVYIVVGQFLRYFKNEDTPKITFKTFNESPEDVYPDLTFCFLGAEDKQDKSLTNIYNDSYLQKHHSLTKQQYQNLLQGYKRDWKNIPNASRVSEVDFNKASIDLNELILVHTGLSHGTPFSHNKTSKKEWIHRTFQLPGMICFTRQFGADLKKDDLFMTEIIEVRLTQVFVYIFVHYPGQMLRSVFGNFRSYKSVLTMTNNQLNSSQIYDIKMNQMTVIKRRPDAAVTCDPRPTDDSRFWKTIFDHLACMPSYWRMFAPVNASVLPCKTFEEFSRLKGFTNTKPLGRDWKPEGKRIQWIKENNDRASSKSIACNEMEIVVTSQMNQDKSLSVEKDVVILNFLYQMQKYQEIRNVKDYGLDSLGSGIGGFVGIFIGYSLLSLLNDGYDLLEYLINVYYSPRRSAKIRQQELA